MLCGGRYWQALREDQIRHHLRLSDFKTNEYANLIGGKAYEPVEENPMIGFRGASRYYDPRYQAGFALECRAMKKVRDDMGLSNLKLMVPFCRTVDEAKRSSSKWRDTACGEVKTDSKCT